MLDKWENDNETSPKSKPSVKTKNYNYQDIISKYN